MTHQPDEAYRIEHHSDPFDVASDVEARARDGAISAARDKAKPQQVARPDGTFLIVDCMECGNDIGAERLRVAARNHFCTHCASVLERRLR